MKKTYIAALAILASSSVFANTTTMEITPENSAKFSKNLQMSWSISNQKDKINITNSTAGFVNVYIAVQQNIVTLNSSTPADPITVHGCVNGNYRIEPGSMIVCAIEPRATAWFEVEAANFKNGSAGSYSTN